MAIQELVYDLDGKTQRFALEQDETIVGRDSDADLVINRRWISRKHARLYRDGHSWRVVDLESLNGTRINDLGHTDKPLADGDKIYLHRMPLTFVDGSAPRVSLTQPEDSALPDLTPQTIIHSAVDFSALAASSPQTEHLQTLLAVLAKASEAIMVSQTLDEVFDRVLDLVFEHLPVERGFVMLWDAEREDFVPSCVKHRSGSEGDEIRFSRTIAEKVYREKVAILTSDAQVDGRFAEGKSVFELDIRSAMAAPLWNDEQVDGLLYADAIRARAFDKFDLDLLSALGNHLAVAIERSRLQESVLSQQIARRRLERYHSPAVIERITRSGGAAEALMAEEREVTVLFADVVGFTHRCEGLEPREIAELLNRYFSQMADMVFRHEGTLDKFIGDSLMAVFGAPLAADDHAVRAVEAALDMREALHQLNAPLDESERLRFRVGMHAGSVVAGDIGSLSRRDYTVLGSTVNLASRLESTVAKADQIIVSDAVRDALGPGYRMRSAGEHQPRGTGKPVTCYELLGREDSPTE